MKKNTADKLYFSMAMAWLCVASLLTVVKFSPAHLNADVLINSVMSLQNVTLYYWGQNRLLNVLPALTSVVSNPADNLVAVLLCTSLTFFVLIYMICRTVVSLAGVAKLELSTLRLFVLLSSAVLIVLKPIAIYEMAIGHVEYSLAAALLVFSFYTFALRRHESFVGVSLSIAAIILAIGLNPSTVIPTVFLSLFAFACKRKIISPESILGGCGLISFLFWSYISSHYEGPSYTAFSPAILFAGLERVISGLIGTVDKLPFLVFFCGVLIVRFFLLILIGPTFEVDAFIYSRNAAVIFSISWVLLFSSSAWVQANDFSWRYFIYVLFAGFFFFATFCEELLERIPVISSLLVVLMTAAVAAASMASPVLGFRDYAVFKVADDRAPVSGSFYAGDYWVVWPAVLREMMQGHMAYGLAYRGSGNDAEARRYMFEHLSQVGYASVYCINDTVESCIGQVNGVLGAFPVDEVTPLSTSVHELKLTADLHYRDARFAGLPAQVGARKEGYIESVSQSGFMVFGPYSALPAGRYSLSLFGQSEFTDGAYLDVVSQQGARVHATHYLSESSEGTLLNNVTLTLPESVTDLEVRVWVGERSRVRLTGYNLRFEKGD